MSEKKREFDEKKLTLIVAALAFLAIMVVILFLTSPGAGDKARINKEYDSLESNDHVFVSITYGID